MISNSNNRLAESFIVLLGIFTIVFSLFIVMLIKTNNAHLLTKISAGADQRLTTKGDEITIINKTEENAKKKSAKEFLINFGKFATEGERKVLKNFFTDLLNKKLSAEDLNGIYGLQKNNIQKLREFISNNSEIFIYKNAMPDDSEGVETKRRQSIWQIIPTKITQGNKITEINDIKKIDASFFLKTEKDKVDIVHFLNIFDSDEFLAFRSKIKLNSKGSVKNLLSKETSEIIEKFCQAIMNRDFDTAYKYVDTKKISSKKLAALLIMIDEHQFKLNDKKPFTQLAQLDKSAWYMVNIIAEKNNLKTDFGIEMKLLTSAKTGEQNWKIDGINFSSLLITLAKNSKAYGIPYIQINDNPKSGERIVLYFEFNESGLHPRAKKQLEIIANILKSNPDKTLKIEGHADALGDDNYNLSLSQNRSHSVTKELEKYSVKKSQIIEKAFGEKFPVAANKNPDGTDNPEGRRKNRRSEIYLDF